MTTAGAKILGSIRTTRIQVLHEPCLVRAHMEIVTDALRVLREQIKDLDLELQGETNGLLTQQLCVVFRSPWTTGA